MAVTFVAADCSNSANVTAVTGLTWPSHAAGDLGLFIGGCVDTETPTMDSDFTLNRTDTDQNLKATVGRRLPAAMTGSESGSISFTTAGLNRMVAGIILLRGASGIGTVTYLAEGGTATSTHSSPAVTLASAADGIVLLYVERQSAGASTITPPSGYTIPANGTFGTGGSGGTVVAMAYKLTGNSSGSNSPGTWSSTNTASNCTVYAVPVTAAASAIDLLVSDLGQAQVIGVPALIQEHVLAASNIAQAQTITAPVLAQVHQLAPADMVQAQALTAPALTQVHQLAVAGLAQAQALQAPALTQLHVLAVASLAQAQTLGAPVLVRNIALTVANLAQGQAISSPLLTQIHVLTVAGLAQAQTLGTVTFSGSGSTLAPANMSQAQGLTAPALVQQHALTVAGLSQQQTLQAPALSQVHSLAVAGIQQAQTLQSLTLTQVHALVVAGLLQGQSLGTPVLTQQSTLTIAGNKQAQSIGVPVLVQSQVLVVAGIRQGQTLSVITLHEGPVTYSFWWWDGDTETPVDPPTEVWIDGRVVPAAVEFWPGD